MKIYKLVVGDWSEDGHGRTQTYVVQANVDLHKAYELGVKKTGFNLESHCNNYEEADIPTAPLHKMGLMPSNYGDHWERDDIDGGYVELTPDGYVKLWLAICAKGMPDLVYEIIEQTLNIGGYGLFL